MAYTCQGIQGAFPLLRRGVFRSFNPEATPTAQVAATVAAGSGLNDLPQGDASTGMHSGIHEQKNGSSLLHQECPPVSAVVTRNLANCARGREITVRCSEKPEQEIGAGVYMARLLSVNVGLPREITWRGKTVYTSVWKEPVQGRCLVRRLNIDGDAQGDLAGHGGEHRAVFVYQIDSYHYWQRELKRTDFTFGQFGENFTVEGLADSEVCVGDRYRIGGALFEVTQPRVTCYRVGIRMDEPRMAALLVAHHRPGFYFRVLEEGEVGAGDEIVKVAEGPERLTVAAVDALLYLPGPAKEELERALRIPALSPGWKSSFEALLWQMTQPESRQGMPDWRHQNRWSRPSPDSGL